VEGGQRYSILKNVRSLIAERNTELTPPRLNPNVKYNAYREHLTLENAINIISQYDIVLDCTDHPKVRYLISDTCILLSRPLVSASALKTDGQLIILNYPPRPAGDRTGGPCYRCVFPKPPPADQIVNCSDGGILGPVVGAMGVLQALQAIKLIISGVSIEDTTTSEFDHTTSFPPPSMLIFSSSNINNPFRVVRLRSRRPDCFACSAKAELTETLLMSGSLDYVAFCGELAPVDILLPEERISAKKYAELKGNGKEEHLLVDVREKVQFDICNIEGSINIPFSEIQGSPMLRSGQGDPPDWLPPDLPPCAPIYVVCRLGNDSQIVTKKFKDIGLDCNGTRYIADIKGGLKAWREQVDGSWPAY
jgi:adenylyltransferase and sulfurtransferase